MDRGVIHPRKRTRTVYLLHMQDVNRETPDAEFISIFIIVVVYGTHTESVKCSS